MKIRLYAKEKGVPLWRLAAYLKISEPTLYRNLRWKIENENLYLNAIDQISKGEVNIGDI